MPPISPLSPEIQEAAHTLTTLLSQAKHIVFFGGAGVSTESGIPDFRSADGLYKQENPIPPEKILSHRYFLQHTASFFSFYRDRMNCLSATPNDAHIALSRWEAEGKLDAVITQNIDGLHQAAGSHTVWELHGSIHRNFCMDCGAPYPASYVFDATHPIPRCAHCGGIVKPDVVLYEESLSSEVLEGAIHSLQQADLLLVAGTSLTVHPAAGLLRFFRGDHMVLVNREETKMDSLATFCFHMPIGLLLSQVVSDMDAV